MNGVSVLKAGAAPTPVLTLASTAVAFDLSKSKECKLDTTDASSRTIMSTSNNKGFALLPLCVINPGQKGTVEFTITKDEVNNEVNNVLFKMKSLT